ncbi:uncharacterized protein LOC113238372 [Hyposmocoma kahamanoa]|uniref:uncharacterized protein LOC113238372 n=1 Tax=Hyposmocoma kahamanoa TaxID=1477025 RepID=UPI000E6D9565|nr:uncharacterized protein LOC113238372 [Hyposmocoma kahamanoa]
MTMLKYVFCFAILAVSLRNVKTHISQETEAALMDFMRDAVVECAKDFSLNVDDLKEQHKSKDSLDGVDKCFVGCILKKKGVINEGGKYDLDRGLEIMRELIANDDDYKVLETTSKDCVSVNDETVSDGDKGCDRAFLLMACLKKEKEGTK